MYNSHLDSNVSLGLNILEGCLNTNIKCHNRRTFGQDINEENAADMMSCAFQMAGALKNIGVVGCYYQIAPAYNWSLCSSYSGSKGPAYWDSIRMLHLLTKYVGTHTKVGEWPLPSAFRLDKQRAAILDGYLESGENKTPALSYTPDIDSHWLGDNALDVFGILRDELNEILIEADVAGIGFVFPEKASDFKKWIKEKAGLKDGCKIISTIFLTVFFPYRTTSVMMEKPTAIADWLLEELGDDEHIARQNLLPLLLYGPGCIRFWISKVLEGK